MAIQNEKKTDSHHKHAPTQHQILYFSILRNSSPTFPSLSLLLFLCVLLSLNQKVNLNLKALWSMLCVPVWTTRLQHFATNSKRGKTMVQSWAFLCLWTIERSLSGMSGRSIDVWWGSRLVRHWHQQSDLQTHEPYKVAHWTIWLSTVNLPCLKFYVIFFSWW